MTNIIIHCDDFGRSPLMSKNILKCIKEGNVNQVSVMVDFVDDKIHQELIATDIETRLHLNLTENKNFIFDGKSKKLSFLNLIFLKKNRKYIYEEIDKQIIEYSRLYGKKKSIRIDGHQHVHMIPWIYNYLINHKKFEIEEIRYPVESFNLVKFKYLINLKFLRNLLAWSLLCILSIFNKKKSNIVFYGMLYSGIYNKEIFLYHTKKLKSNKNKEVLIHAGYTDNSEFDLFSKKDFKFYSSQKRRIENSLAYLDLS